MAGFSTLTALVTSINAGQETDYQFTKVSSQAEGAGVWHTAWAAAGNPPSGAAQATGVFNISTSAAICSGGLFFPSVSPELQYGLTFGGTANAAITLMVADRLIAWGGLNLTSTGTINLSAYSLPRWTNGVGVQAWFEVTTATATTALSANLSSYTNQAGTTGLSGPPIQFPAAVMKAGDMVGPIPVNGGDSGIQSVQSIFISTASSAGVASLVLLRPLAYISLPVANQWNERDLFMQLAAMPNIPDGACLQLVWFATAASTPIIQGVLRAASN